MERPGERDRATGDRAGAPGRRQGAVHARAQRVMKTPDATAARARRRWSRSCTSGLARAVADPDSADIAVRAEAAFDDHQPAWPLSPFQSVDVQVAARGEAALAAGDYLAVVGDVHLGNNPLIQGVFAHRHADPAALLSRVTATAGRGMPVMLPPWSPTMGFDARGMPRTSDDMVHLAVDARDPRAGRPRAPGARRAPGRRRRSRRSHRRAPGPAGRCVLAADLRLAACASSRSFRRGHSQRVTVGGMVLRREGWSIPAGEVPDRAEDVAAFARDRGMPRRLFTKSPLERKPMYLDTDERRALADPLSPGPPRRCRLAGSAVRVHRDAAHARPVLARRRRRQPLRIGAAHGRGRRGALAASIVASTATGSPGQRVESRPSRRARNGSTMPVIGRVRPRLRPREEVRFSRVRRGIYRERGGDHHRPLKRVAGRRRVATGA